MDINTNVVKNYQTAEYGKFVELKGTEFPPVSVVRLSYPDTSSAFPANSGLKPLSSVDIYPKYAILTHIANPEDISISLSAGNININLQDVEDLVSEANTKLDVLTGQILTVNQNVSATNTRLTSINDYTENISNNIDNHLYQLDNIYNDTQNIYGEISNYLYQLGDIYTDTQNIYSDVNSYLPYLESVNSALTAINPNLPSINAAVNDTNITQTTTSALTSNLLITGPRRMYSIFGVSTSTSNQYIHLYDSNSSTPVGTPVGVFVVPANSNFSFDISKGLKFINGCLVTNSLTLGTYSAGANDLYFTVVHTN